MSRIGYIRLPLLKEEDFALIPYDKVERELLSENEFIELLDMRIKAHLAELTSKAIREDEND